MKPEKKEYKNQRPRHVLTRSTLLAGAAALMMSTVSHGAVILTENFEDGLLDARLSVTTVGTAGAGIKDYSFYAGSDKSFGFGTSSCGASCFTAHTTLLQIDFGAPVFVDTLSFKEMELFGNWGSQGKIIVDGVYLGTSASYSPPAWPSGPQDFDRLPVNDGNADSSFRTRSFAINQTVSTLGLYVWDITNRSEIYIDDLQVTGGNSNHVPEPGTLFLLAGGLASLLGMGGRFKASRKNRMPS